MAPTRSLWAFIVLVNLSLLPLWAQSGSPPAPSTPTPSTETPTPESTPVPTPIPTPTPRPRPTAAPAAIFISDSGNSRLVRVATIDGIGFDTFGYPGKGPGRLLNPGQVWVDPKGKIYLADTGNDRIIRMDEMSGKGYIEMEGFKAPRGVCSKGDELYVADTGNNQVKVYDDIKGKLLRTYQDHRLDHPVSLWLDEKAALYVACGNDPPGGRVVKIAEPNDLEGKHWEVYSGEELRTVSGFAPSQALTIKDQLYVADSASSRLVRVDDFKGLRPHEYGGIGRAMGKLNSPLGAGLDKSGHIYIADTQNDRIVRIDDITGRGWVSYGGPKEKRQVDLRQPSSVFVWCPVPAPTPAASPKKGEENKTDVPGSIEIAP